MIPEVETAHGRPATARRGLAQSTAKRVASLADLPGIEKAVPGTDVAQIERSVTRMASQIAAAPLDGNVLAGAFAFVFLNFVLLFLQTIRSKPIPKVVQDTFQASASFLIGAGTSLWMT